MKTDIKIGRHVVQVSNLTKVLYPKVGFTKGQVIDYYLKIAPVLLPHLKNRPVTMKRFPDGVDGFFFYEKHCPSHRPRWIETKLVKGTGTPNGVRFCLINDPASLAWAAQLANLELHTVLGRAPRLEQPTSLVFDLDPGEPVDVLGCARTALWLRQKLQESNLKGFVKTSGSKGLQLYVPLNKPVSYEAVKSFARDLAETLEREHGDLVVSKMSKALRRGKVFIDWSQNNRHKTTVCVYSLRGREQPTVSTPVTWEEVGEALEASQPDRLVFRADQVIRRVDEHGDIFAPVLKLKQSLPNVDL